MFQRQCSLLEKNARPGHLERADLKTHWVLVIMDQFTRRIIGFCLHRGDVFGLKRWLAR